jgi:protein-disulfide isomerase
MATLKIPVSSSDHLQGNPKAPVILVEYGDYQCPHCGHAYPIVKRVQDHFGDKLGFVFRNFPLNEIHPAAESAAETAEFAATKGKFWEMHDAIFEHQRNLSDDSLMSLAKQLGLSPTELRDAWSAETFTPRVKSDFVGGARSGVNGTPTFFINGHRHDANFEFEDLVEAINAALA